mmetsp:Transcript_57253/g.157184  ORF Transcript_57253/g.157184 Transcript_57253/m.157184 type:complete len:246 (-) Transcript_57253:188-925(-)
MPEAHAQVRGPCSRVDREMPPPTSSSLPDAGVGHDDITSPAEPPTRQPALMTFRCVAVPDIAWRLPSEKAKGVVLAERLHHARGHDEHQHQHEQHPGGRLDAPVRPHVARRARSELGEAAEQRSLAMRDRRVPGSALRMACRESVRGGGGRRRGRLAQLQHDLAQPVLVLDRAGEHEGRAQELVALLRQAARVDDDPTTGVEAARHLDLQLAVARLDGNRCDTRPRLNGGARIAHALNTRARDAK